MDNKHDALHQAICLIEKAMGRKADQEEEDYAMKSDEPESEDKPAPSITAVFMPKRKK